MTQDIATTQRNFGKLVTRLAFEVQLFIEEQGREGDQLITAETLLALAQITAAVIATGSAPAKDLEWFIGCLSENPSLVGKTKGNTDHG